jgi:hypothetical protein
LKVELTGGAHLSACKEKEKKEEQREGGAGWFGGSWAGSVPGSAQRLPFSFFCSSSFSFLFSYSFCNFCKNASNQLKPLS